MVCTPLSRQYSLVFMWNINILWQDGSSPVGGDETLDLLMSVDSVPVDPVAVDTIPCNLPQDYSPGVAPEAPSSSSSGSAMSLSQIDQRIMELQFLGCKRLSWQIGLNGYVPIWSMEPQKLHKKCLLGFWGLYLIYSGSAWLWIHRWLDLMSFGLLDSKCIYLIVWPYKNLYHPKNPHSLCPDSSTKKSQNDVTDFKFCWVIKHCFRTNRRPLRLKALKSRTGFCLQACGILVPVSFQINFNWIQLTILFVGWIMPTMKP